MSWPLVKLGDCCTVVGGATPKREKPEYWDSPDIPWVTPKDVSNLSHPVLDDAPEYISELGYKSCSAQMLPAGAILLTSRAPIGNVAIAGRAMCTNQGFKSLVPGEQVFGPFLYHCVKHFSAKLESLGNGATFKEVSKKIVEDFEIPLPPLKEQKRIAAILDKADAIHRKRQQAIKLADDLLRSVFLEMFGDPVSQGWDFVTIGEMASANKGSMRTGPFGSDLKHSEFTEEGVAVLGIDNAVKNKFSWDKERFISQKKYQELKRYTVRPGDVLITIMGTCGRCAVVPDDIPLAINTKHLCCITLDTKKCLPDFLHSYYLYHPIATKYLNKMTKGAIMDGLNLGIIKEMPIPVVPIKKQNDFYKIKMLVENLSKKMTEGNSSLLFPSLQHRAFSGELAK